MYAAAVGFLAVSLFLVWRNWKLWREPFHNLNAGEVWIDHWRDVFVLRLSPEHAQLGLRWYLAQHSLLQLFLKLGRGAGQIAGVFIYTAGIGFWNPVARVVTGVGTLALAGFGLRRRWRGGERTEVVAVLSTQVVFFAALALGASGAPGPQVRYVLPYVILIVPYAALELVAGVWPRVHARLAVRHARIDCTALGLLATVLVARFALAVPSVMRADPRTLYAVEPRWHQTSAWLSQALDPGERFAIPYMSRYSTWDLPRPDVDPRWAFWFGVPAPEAARHHRPAENPQGADGTPTTSIFPSMRPSSPRNEISTDRWPSSAGRAASPTAGSRAGSWSIVGPAPPPHRRPFASLPHHGPLVPGGSAVDLAPHEFL